YPFPTLLHRVDEISPSPTNPRKRFESAALDQLADSIRTVGIQQAIVIRKVDGEISSTRCKRVGNG
ncbi:hypothetical protein EON81_24175, partial [bacterium]